MRSQETSDISKFKVQSQRSQKNDHDTKFYFKPNSLNILIKRLIKDGEEFNNSIEYYEEILAPYDLSILTKILKKINKDKNRINENTALRFIKIAIENINNEKILLANHKTSLEEWYHIFTILSTSPLHRKKKYNDVIKEKIKFFDQQNLIEEITKNCKNKEKNKQAIEIILKTPTLTMSKEYALLYKKTQNIESQIKNEEALVKTER